MTVLYLKGAVGPETVAAMAVVGREVRQAVPLPLGVQVNIRQSRKAPPQNHVAWWCVGLASEVAPELGHDFQVGRNRLLSGRSASPAR